MSDQQTETALPQGVQERIAIRARQDAMALGFEFDADMAGVATIEKALSRAMLAAVHEALEQGRAQAPLGDDQVMVQALTVAEANRELVRRADALVAAREFAVKIADVKSVYLARLLARKALREIDLTLPAPPSTGAPNGDRTEP